MPGRRHEPTPWEDLIPTDMAYLDQAYEYLDQTRDDYIRWRLSRGYEDSTNIDPVEEAERARRLAQAWKDLGWTNGDVNNFLNMNPIARREMVHDFAMGRHRRKGFTSMSTEEAALFYHE